MKYFVVIIVLLCVSFSGFAQDISTLRKQKKEVVKDTIILEPNAIKNSGFKVISNSGINIDTTAYRVDFQNGILLLNTQKIQSDSITIQYEKYPDFLTRDYFLIDTSAIVSSTKNINKVYALENTTETNNFTPFDGLNTLGSISRGITIGTNQNAVVNSQLDLQITGKLSDNVSIRASIQDANVPTQESGYSQSLDEFDQIFIELYGKKWNIRAGDIDLVHTNSYFAKFTKKIQGISLGGELEDKNGGKTTAYAAGALVRGVFSKSEFTGQEGNQGPYKLVGPNGELFILIVSGSERVYANGLLLERGENKDYIIDYNAGELIFNPTFPVTANIRFKVEYQYTDRNYTRFIGFGGGNYSNSNFNVGAYFYSENDAKNQPLQQNLSEEQVAILEAAGDNKEAMVAPSAIPDSYSENKILYKKEDFNGEEIFVFSSNPEDELYSVRFSFVGENNGNYVVSDENAISKIYEFIPPIEGIPQGDYEPIIQLDAPTKLQLLGVKGGYHPSEKTNIAFELTGSRNDLNLFSSIDNENNDGFAGRIEAQQKIATTKDSLTIKGIGSFDYIDQNFRTIERVYNIEFNRDWNLINPLGNQQFAKIGVAVEDNNKGGGSYEYQNLSYSENFNGGRHVMQAGVLLNKFKLNVQGSLLSSKSDSLNSKFNRLHSLGTYSFSKSWVGAKISLEDNQIKNIDLDSLQGDSQKYQTYEVFTGIGDSTKIYAEIGYNYRVNDSLQNGILQKVNHSNSVFVKSRILNSPKSQLQVFANYRSIKDADTSEDDEESLNTRLLYNQTLAKGIVRLNTSFESNNGVLAQQEFTFVQVEPGQGVYTWIDYNNNGIQELNEFEIAQYQDEAEYIRVLLPNQIFLKIRQHKFSQIVTLNPQQWRSENGFKKVVSHFYNQTSYALDKKVNRTGNAFDINPFDSSGDETLGLSSNFRNVLFYNRGKQHFTTSYTFVASSVTNLLAIGLQENKISSHQLLFNHKIKSWITTFKGVYSTNISKSENYESRNFDLNSYALQPKIAFLASKQTRFDLYYELNTKENTIASFEELQQHTIGLSGAYTNGQKISINGSFNYIKNSFTGNALSPVAYQMLEGLQPGTNFTWNLLLQKRITKFLDVNLSYLGRKSETSKAIHTGSVQLRAYF